jgi:hypothetical protein
METKGKLLRLLERTYEEEQTLVAKLSKEQRLASGTLEQWSTKDLIAHLAYWKQRRAQSITAASADETSLSEAQENEINAQVFEENRNLAWEKVLANAKQAYDLLVRAVKSVPNEALGNTHLACQEGRPLWRIMAVYGCTHPISHLAEHYHERGDSQSAMRIWEDFEGWLVQLDDSSSWRGIVQYNLACRYALSGQPAVAICRLREALQLNPDLTEWSRQDPDFTSLRDHPRYRALYQK